MLLWRPRHRLFLCALLDAAGFLLIASLIDRLRGTDLLKHPQWLVPFMATFLLLGWLFGSYTVLRWPWLRLRLVVFRLLATSLGTLLVVAVSDWMLNLPPAVSISHRSVVALMLIAISAWGLAVRLLLRWISQRTSCRDWNVRGSEEHLTRMEVEWKRTPYAVVPRVAGSTPDEERNDESIKPSNKAASLWRRLLCQPRDERPQLQTPPVATVLELAELQLERLPPSLLPEDWIGNEEIPWSDSFSVQRQLKRAADVTIALLLLVITLPLMGAACLLIWLEDRGPVFYSQQRSGLMGKPFRVLKLRTMRSSHQSTPATWTQPGDSRITRVGGILRRVRLDEIPQLLNVLSGEMSLIGPRPERPELEEELERQIPHYRKRHWMPPGMSGWAQVCSPYAASVDEAELKLSYDLYYLKHWNTGLDLLILAKTIKTVLKARGR